MRLGREKSSRHDLLTEYNHKIAMGSAFSRIQCFAQIGGITQYRLQRDMERRKGGVGMDLEVKRIRLYESTEFPNNFGLLTSLFRCDFSFLF